MHLMDNVIDITPLSTTVIPYFKDFHTLVPFEFDSTALIFVSVMQHV